MDADREHSGGSTRSLARTKRRRRPLVSRGAVLRWAWAAGIEVPDGPLDDMIVDLYLAREERKIGTDGAPGAPAVPAVAPAVLLAPVAPKPPPARDHRAFGPEPCAKCGGPGYLDHLDLERRTQSQRCRCCNLTWVSAIAL